MSPRQPPMNTIQNPLGKGSASMFGCTSVGSYFRLARNDPIHNPKTRTRQPWQRCAPCAGLFALVASSRPASAPGSARRDGLVLLGQNDSR